MNKKEADKLGPGDLICREDDPQWTFIVSQNNHSLAVPI